MTNNNTWIKRPIGKLLERVVCPVEVKKDTVYQEIGIRSHCKGIFYKPHVQGKQIGNKRVFWVEPDCFIYNVVFAWEQAIAVTSKNEKGMIASHRFPMYRSINGQFDPKYAFLYFSSPRGKYDLGLASPGGAGRNKTLGQEEFKRIKVPVPSVKYQKIAIDVIRLWDEGIEKAENLIVAKQKRKTALMQQLLMGKKRFKEFKEQKWKTANLSNYCVFKGGSTFKREHQGYREGDIPFIKVSDMNHNDNRIYIYKANNWITTDNQKETGTTIFPPNTIVFAKVGAALLLNKRRILMRDTAIDNNMMGAIPKSNLNYHFLYQFMLTIDFSKFVQEGALPSINQSHLSSLNVKFPELKEQQKIALVLNTADREIELLQKQLEAMKRQKKGLMQKLLAGKIRVKV